MEGRGRHPPGPGDRGKAHGLSHRQRGHQRNLSLDLPEADLILLSLDGDRERHNAVRGDTYDLIMENIKTLPLTTSAFTWPSTRSIRTPSAMCAGPPGIQRMCGPFPLISILPMQHQGAGPVPGGKGLLLPRHRGNDGGGRPGLQLKKRLSLSDQQEASPSSLPPVRGHGKRDPLHLRPLHLCPGPVQPVRLFLCGGIYTLIFQGKPGSSWIC